MDPVPNAKRATKRDAQAAVQIVQVTVQHVIGLDVQEIVTTTPVTVRLVIALDVVAAEAIEHGRKTLAGVPTVVVATAASACCAAMSNAVHHGLLPPVRRVIAVGAQRARDEDE